MVGVAPPRRQMPNSAGKSVDIEDSCDDNHSFDDLYSSSDENEVCYILARYCDTYVDYLIPYSWFFVVLKFREWLILSFSRFYFHDWSSQIAHVSCSMS